jgi:hypothetical protein
MRNNKYGGSVLFIAILLISTIMVPAVSGAADSAFVPTEEMKKKGLEPLPEIKVIEATDTSNIVQVGDVLVSLKSNDKHTEAELYITDLITDEVTTINYEVEEVNGKFKTNVYMDDNLLEAVTTDYNPIKPGEFSKISDFYEQDNSINTEATLASTTMYVWDDVTFIKGSGIKYPHPDYDWYDYKGEVWESWKISGTELNHYHVSDGTSATLLPLPALAIGTALGGLAGGIPGAVAGALLAQTLGGSTAAVLVDEEGCFWVWWAKDWGLYLMPPLNTVQYVPKYLRIGPYELWDKISMTNP